MNSANQPPAPQRPTDDQLEERIVAWVLGEASDFEIAALEAAVAARPELAAFKRRIEAGHGLVAEAARPDAAPLRLSPDRRAKLLAVIGSPVAGGADPGKSAAVPKAVPSSKPSAARLPRASERPWWRTDWFYSAAACVVISIGGFGMLSTVPTFKETGSRISYSEVDMARYKAEEEAEELPEPMNTVGFADITSVAKPAALSHNWSPPSTQTRSFSGAGAAPQRETAGRHVAVDRVRGYIGTTDDGATGVLDKFEVHETGEYGYTASSTLAGSRTTTKLNLPGVVRMELKDEGSAISVADKAKNASRDDFLSKRKAERSGGKGSALPPAPAAPSIGADDKEIVVLSPFEVANSQDSGFLKANRAPKKPKRPDPSATSAGIGPGGLIASGVGGESGRSDLSPSTADSDKPLPRPAQKLLPSPTADETSAAQEPVSTFSLHVSDASFKLALAALAAGRMPDAASIRPEEFYNAFDYGDPAPGAGEKVSCRVEQSAHPFAQQRNLVRIAVRVPATGRGSGTPLNLTVLLDTSGSMERPDRRAAVRAALATLVGLLGPNDRLTLIGFARQPRLLAEAFDGAHANQALGLLDSTPAEGGTNLEEALKLGAELARRHFAEAAQNRIVLLTDGAANLGNAEPERLAAAIETLRSQRIAFDACGVGLEGVEDEMLEALTRKGDGRYYVLDSPEAADAGFARQLAGAFRPAAENVKLQVRFNPARVGRYRLVGFEKHRLREEDFRNDAVDAAEISAEEAAVAVYEIEALPQGEGELGEVFVRFRDAATKTMVERSWTLPYESRAAAFDRAAPSLQLAGTAAALAEKLRGGPAGDRVDLDALAPIVNAQRARRPDDKRIQDLATLFEQVRKMKK